ncbi:ABC transporter substrate-binding protein [Intestinibacillus massiliensis]|uniref:ABC transporter substrate-binding protein n=1 Tax=Intestinibacillus massiliensis TaxID=1871029 RepID=UPI000B34AF1E|nr:extracellular solute-binding protein [Intestinibacillus massiliensis]
MKRWKALLLCGVMLCLGTAGYAWHSRQTDAPSAPQHVIRVVLWDYGTVTYDKRMVEAFEQENPDVRVEVISYPPTYYNSSLEALLDSGERVDVIYVNQLPELVGLYARDIPLPLDELVKRDGIDLSAYPDTGVLRQDGRLMALPYRQDKFVLYYNIDLFDEAGIPYPEEGMTWDAFREAGKQLTDRLGKGRFGVSLLKKEEHMCRYMLDAPPDWSKDDFSKLRPGLELWRALEQDGSIPRLTDSDTQQFSQRMFETGAFGMFVHGSWYMNFLMADRKAGRFDFRWGVVSKPRWADGATPVNDAWVTPVCINRNSGEQEAAWRFIKFVSGPEGARILAEELVIPAYHSAGTDAALARTARQNGIDPAVCLEGFAPPQAPPDAQGRQILDALCTGYGRALLGLDGIGESIDAMSRERARILHSP